MEDLILNQDVFLLFIDKSIQKYRADIANITMPAIEVEKTYHSIETLLKLKKSIEETTQNYKKYIDELEKLKENSK